MLLQHTALIDLFNDLRKPAKGLGSLSSEEMEGMEFVRGMWLRLVEHTIRTGQSQELRYACGTIGHKLTTLREGLGVGEPSERLLPALIKGKLLRKLSEGGRFSEGLTARVEFLETEGQPAFLYNIKIESSIALHLRTLGDPDWAKIKQCLRCKNYFLKKHRQQYCSPKCLHARWQPKYDEKRREYMKVYRQFVRLVNERRLSHEDARKKMIVDQRYSRIIKEQKLYEKMLSWEQD